MDDGRTVSNVREPSGQRLIQLAQRGDQGTVGRVVDRARDDADGVVWERFAQAGSSSSAAEMR